MPIAVSLDRSIRYGKSDSKQKLCCVPADYFRNYKGITWSDPNIGTKETKMSLKSTKRCLEIFARNWHDINPTIYVEYLSDDNLINRLTDYDHFLIYGHPSDTSSVRVAFGSSRACLLRSKEVEQAVISMALNIDPTEGFSDMRMRHIDVDTPLREDVLRAHKWLREIRLLKGRK